MCVCLLVSHIYMYLHIFLFYMYKYFLLYFIPFILMVFRVWIFCWVERASERAGAHGCQVSATQVLSLTHLNEPNLSSPIHLLTHTYLFVYTYILNLCSHNHAICMRAFRDQLYQNKKN